MLTRGTHFRADLRLRRLARHLAQWRASSEMTGVEAAKAAGFSQTKLSKLENAVQPIAPSDVMALALVYRVPATEREHVFNLALGIDEPEPGRARLQRARDEYMALEARATSLGSYRSDQLPPLLQTSEYATEAMLAQRPTASYLITREQAERETHRRRALLSRQQLRVELVVDESALRREVGGARTMREQLLHLITLADLPHVVVRVVPFPAGAHAASGASFDLLHFVEPHFPDVVYLEGLADATFLESPDETGPYERRFADAVAHALTPKASVEFIAARAEDL